MVMKSASIVILSEHSVGVLGGDGGVNGSDGHPVDPLLCLEVKF